ncbi:MAG: hypothetical protein ABII18_10215 [bacterium]
MAHTKPLTLTPDERLLFAQFSDTPPELASQNQLLQTISDVLDNAGNLPPDEQAQAYSLAYQGYSFLQQKQAESPAPSETPSVSMGHILLADLTPQRRIFFTAQDALQWFDEIPRTYPGVISHGKEKFLALIPPGETQRGTQCILLTKKQGAFVKLVINDSDENTVEKGLYKSLTLLMRRSLAVQNDYDKKSPLSSSPELKLTEMLSNYFRQYSPGATPYEPVRPSDFIFDGRRLSLIHMENEQDRRFTHAIDFYTPSIGKRHLATSTSSATTPIQTPHDWFLNLTSDNPNVLFVDETPVFISVSPNDTYTGLDSIAFISPSLTNSGHIQFSPTPQLDKTFEDLYHMNPQAFAHAIEHSLKTGTPLKGKALRIVRSFIHTPVNSEFDESHIFQNIIEDITHFVHFDSGYVTDFIYNPHAETRIPFAGTNFTPYFDYHRKKQTPALPPYEWFSNLTPNLEFVSVINGQKYAYLVDPRHPKDEALILYETFFNDGSPALGIHHLSSAIALSVVLLDDLFNHFSSGKTQPLSANSESMLRTLLQNSTERRLRHDANQTQIRHTYGHSFTQAHHDRFVHLMRSDYSGRTQITWFDPFSQTPALAQGTIHTTLHGSDIEHIKVSLRQAEETQPLDWFHKFTPDHPSIIPVQTTKGTTNVLILATQQGGELVPSINIAYEHKGILYLFPLDRSPHFNTELGTDAVALYDDLITHIKSSKTTKLPQQTQAALQRIVRKPSQHPIKNSDAQVFHHSSGHISFTVALGKVNIEILTGTVMRIYEAAPFSDIVALNTPTNTPIATTEMQKLPVSFDASRGLERIALYHDPRSQQGIALTYKADEKGQKTNEMSSVLFFQAPVNDVNDLRDLIYYTQEVATPNEEQIFEDGNGSFHLNIINTENKANLGQIHIASTRPGIVQIQTSTQRLQAKLWSDQITPYHELLTVAAPEEEYSLTNFQFIDYTTTKETPTEHEISIPLGISHADSKTTPIDVRVAFQKNERGTPLTNEITITIATNDNSTTFSGNIIPYNPQGEHTEGLYLASFTLGDYRFFIGIVIEDLYAPENKDYFAHKVLKQRITNYDALISKRDHDNKLKQLAGAINNLNGLNTQRARTHTIGQQVSSGANAKAFISFSSGPVPLQARFNQDKFRNLRLLRPGRQTGITIDLKFFHDTTYSFRVTSKEKTGNISIYRLETTDPTFPGHSFIMTDNGTSCTFDFSHDTQIVSWLESLAFGPRLEAQFDKISGIVTFDITQDPYGLLSKKFPLKKVHAGQNLEHLDTALKALKQARAVYDKSLGLYQEAATNRMTSPLQEKWETQTRTIPLIHPGITDAPAEASVNIDILYSPEGTVLERRLSSVTIRGQSLGTDGLGVVYHNEPLYLPLTIDNMPLSINIERETQHPEGKESFTLSILNTRTMKIVGTHNFTPYKKDEQVTRVRPEIIHAEYTTNDPFEIDITTKTHSKYGTQYFATLKPTGLAARLSGLEQTEPIQRDPNTTTVSFVVPQIGTLTYELTGLTTAQIKAERLAPEFLWAIEENSGTLMLTIMDVEDNLDTLNFPVTNVGTSDNGPFCLSPDHLDVFTTQMALHGIEIPIPDHQKQLRIDVADAEFPVFSLVNLTAGLATKSNIIIPDAAKAALKEAAAPADVLAAPSPDAVSETTQPQLLRNLATRENLQFDPHEKFVTGERTIHDLINALKETPITLSEAYPYWYEIRAVDSGIVLRIPFQWHPSDAKKNVLSLDYGRPIQAYVYGDAPENAISLTDDRYRIIQTENGAWNIKFLDVSGGVEFDILTTNQGWFRSAANLKDDQGNIAAGNDRSTLLKAADHHNQKHVAKIAQVDFDNLPKLIFSSRKQSTRTRTGLNDFRYYNPDGSWIELSGINVVGSFESFSFPSLITANIGTPSSTTPVETITLTPPLYKEGLGRHTFCLMEQLPNGETGRTFYWRPFEAPFFIEATEIDTTEADFDDLVALLPAQNIFTTQARQTNKHVTSEVDHRIKQIAQHLREYGYPEDTQIKSAKTATPELLRERFDALHDQIWVPDKESLVTETLTGGDRITLRFLSRQAIIEIPMIMDEDSGQYKADASRTVLMLLKELENNDSYLRLNLSINNDETALRRSNGNTLTQLTTSIGEQSLSMDLVSSFFKTTFNRDAFGFRSALPVQRAGKAKVTNTEVKATMGLWLSFNGLDKDAEIIKQPNNQPVETPSGSLALHVGEKSIADTTFRFQGIDLVHSGPDEGKAYTRLTETGGQTRQLEVSRAANNTSALYVHGLGQQTAKPSMIVASNSGETCLIPPSPDTARFVFVQELQQFKTLNQQLQPYANKVKSSAGIIVEEETNDKIIFSVTFLPGRNQSSNHYKEALDKGVFRKVACHLHYDKNTGKISPEPGARIRIQPKPGDPIEWLDASVETVLDHNNNLRIYFKGNKGYSWIEFDNFDKLISADACKQKQVKPTQGMYGFAQHGKPFLMPGDTGFLSIFFGMHTYANDRNTHEKIEAIYQDFFTHILNTTGKALKKELIKSKQTFASFELFASAVAFCGVSRTEPRFEAAFNTMVKTVKALKGEIETPTPSAPKPHSKASTDTPTPSSTASPRQTRVMPVRRPAINLARRTPLTPQTRRIRPISPIGPIRPINKPTTLASLNYFAQPLASMPAPMMLFRPI